jgi:hypothetical protein
MKVKLRRPASRDSTGEMIYFRFNASIRRWTN